MKDLRYSQWRRQVLKRLPPCAKRPDKMQLVRAYSRGLSVRGAVLWLT